MNLMGKGLTNQYNQFPIFKGKNLYFGVETKIFGKSLLSRLDPLLGA